MAVPLPTNGFPGSLFVLLLCPPFVILPLRTSEHRPSPCFFVLFPETSQTPTRQRESSLESFLLLTGNLLHHRPCCCPLSSSAPVRSQLQRLLPLRRRPKKMPAAAPPPPQHPRRHPQSRLLLHQPQSQRIQLPLEQYVHVASYSRESHFILILTGGTEWLQVLSYFDKCLGWRYNWSGSLHPTWFSTGSRLTCVCRMEILPNRTLGSTVSLWTTLYTIRRHWPKPGRFLIRCHRCGYYFR